MNEYFGFRNFRQFERSRRDIRLPHELLKDMRFRQLSDAQKAHLLCLLLLAARWDNVLPNRPARLGRLIGATEAVDLSGLAEFVNFASAEGIAAVGRIERRPISDAMRAAVLVRDQGRCRRCGSARSLEIDHIVPVSKDGPTEEWNLQTLCRRCNRRKWKQLVPRI
ncbi:MAG TPA: HNH endonuclease signature motif containing protein [Candidatus Binataceae bacterium]|nr:HNH endonuclease signature motif containing protein [Candidatus Binataceae bacterium]